MKEDRGVDPSLYDVDYGVTSVAITTTADVIVCTTGANYHGFKLITNTAVCTVKVYDNASTTSGNLLDVALVGVTAGTNTFTWIPTKAKNGIVVNVSGTLATGIVFFGPKG